MKGLESVFAAWIAMLSDCGVDLLSYGLKERQLYDEGSMHYRRRFFLRFSSPTAARLFFVGFTYYGARPEQWRLWWTFEYEEYVEEFWNLVESREFKMPGSWVDEPWDLDDLEEEEDRRLEMWEREETTPLIWSEYRKIRPPV
ncbi:Ankyrin repeat-containing protein [Colletotrichum graminicola]|nr:Ankyrin repeat-containing protein [Colletotrichum graminicola]